MDLEEGLEVYLSGATSVVDALGRTRNRAELRSLILDNTKGTIRYYPLRLPQPAGGSTAPVLPAVTYQRIDTAREHTLDQSGTGGLAHPRIQLSVWANGYGSGRAVANALRHVLLGYKGLVGEVYVDSVELRDERESIETNTQRYQAFLDFIFWYRES